MLTNPILNYMLIRPIKPLDFKVVESLISETIIKNNSKDYDKEVINFMIKVDPFRPRDTSHERDYFVYSDKEIYGIIGAYQNEIKTFFVSSLHQGKGVGKLLLSHIEKFIIKKKYKKITVYSSVSAKSFYEKNGYKVIKKDISNIDTKVMLRYYMEKNIIIDD